MFPIENKTIEEAASAAAKPIAAEEIGRSIKFDYGSREFIFLNGVAEEVTQTEAVKQWLELMCRTLPDKYAVYGNSGFGIETDEIIGYKTLPKGFLYSEIQRQIKENAKIPRCIKSIINFSAENVDGELNIYFTAVLYTGEEVNINANI